jgi:flagellar hook assembly protein FlgD
MAILSVKGAEPFLQLGSRSDDNKQIQGFQSSGFKKEYNLARAKESFQEQEMNQTKIMAAMIRNQLPGDEVDPQKFNDSLMMMMNTKQIMGMSELMQENNTLMKLSHNVDMSGLLNTQIKVDAREFIHNGENEQNFSYFLPESCSFPKFEIFHVDDQYKPVFSKTLDSEKISGSVHWNGLDSEGDKVEAGHYIIKVGGKSATRKNLNDEAMDVQGATSFFTVVDSVMTDPEAQETFLVSNRMAINARDVQMISNVNPYQRHTEFGTQLITQEA